MTVPQLLLETLQGLRKDDFETLKWHLSNNMLEGCKPIPVAYLENAPRTNTVSRMIESYGEELAVKVTAVILRKMGNNNAADELEKRYTALPAAAAAAPAVPAAMNAQHGSGIIAPTITGSTIGELHITYEQKK